MSLQIVPQDFHSVPAWSKYMNKRLTKALYDDLVAAHKK